MANYSANQYEKAFSPKYLQNWSPAKPTKERIPAHEGYTQVIANDRGHLLPSVPRSKQEGGESPAAKVPSNSYCNVSAPDSRQFPQQDNLYRASPWGSFVGTWQMPLKIPPARVSLTSRSAAAAASLTTWIQKDPAFLKASNGLCPEILGKPGDPDSRKQPPNSGKQPPSPAPSPSSPASNPGSPTPAQSEHPSAGHTPGPPGPASPASPCTSHTGRC